MPAMKKPLTIAIFKQEIKVLFHELFDFEHIVHLLLNMYYCTNAGILFYANIHHYYSHFNCCHLLQFL